MASLLDIVLPDAIAAARPTLHHLRLIDSGNKRTRRPSPAEIEKIFCLYPSRLHRHRSCG
jgi:hypothetical protein